MGALRLILGDQLTLSLPILRDCNKDTDVVLMAEVKEEATYVKHHKKKIAFIFSAMRHFAQELGQQGYKVHYVNYDAPNNKGSLVEEVDATLQRYALSQVIVTEPGEYRLKHAMQQWEKQLSTPVTILDDTRFIASLQDFADWAKGRKQYRMEYYYRELRKRTGYLMQGKSPIGGQWNYDVQNRQPFPDDITIPAPTQFEKDEITMSVLSLVEQHFDEHFGDLEPFNFAVTRAQALVVLQHFIEQRLPRFGDYQDAMKQGDPWLFHSHLSFYINTGLLLPDEVIEAAESAYFSGEAPLNCVEGFIRQILGWREYIRGFYWHFMPTLSEQNYLQATRPLPEFFWNTHANMNCLRQCFNDTKKYAYAHHIQRLMVIGNFSLLAGLDPRAVNEWYLLVYADAFEWVEMPNVQAMVLFADGGKLASKPYIASGAYINKMSNYCQQCHYSVTKKVGEKACPFNYLYWHFLITHKDKLKGNPRLSMPYNTLGKMSEAKLTEIQDSAVKFFAELDGDADGLF